MKKLILFILFNIQCSVFISFSQNLVPNPSFENNNATYDSIVQGCLLATGGISTGAIPYWDSPSAGTPDPFDTCAPQYSPAGIPNSWYGYQQPHTGHGMAGAGFYKSDGFREYIQVPLITPLVFDHKYCASFFVNLADTVIVACNNFGMYFSDVHINDSSNQNNLNYTPQINSTAIVTDQFNWTEITGQYTAHGGESYIIIGNFFPNSQTNTLPVTGWSSVNYAYYFIDDVNIRDCTNDGVNEMDNPYYISVSPNPNNGKMTLNYKLKENENGVLTVREITGKLIFSTSLKNSDNILNIDLTGLSQGIYFYQINIDDVNIKTDKLIIVK